MQEWYDYSHTKMICTHDMTIHMPKCYARMIWLFTYENDMHEWYDYSHTKMICKNYMTIHVRICYARIIWLFTYEKNMHEFIWLYCKMIKCQQHLVFPGGHPSRYWPDPTLLNFADRTRSGAFSVVWPLALAIRWKSHVIIHNQK